MRPFKKYKWVKLMNAQYLSALFVASLMLPVLILVYTEKNSFLTSAACVMIPLGGYTLFSSLMRRSGWMVWLGLPLIFLSVFQIVLSYLFGNSVVSADMLLNLLTTNYNEASELLINLYPVVIAVLLIYIPLLWLAAKHIHRKVLFCREVRLRMVVIGTVVFLFGCLVLVIGCGYNVKHVLRDELFPINAAYNVGVAIAETHRIANYDESSKNFHYKSQRENAPVGREVYVLVIGEASRAASWQIFGYERETNPLLSRRKDVVLFRNVMTQSNTTHKSVPMILSSVHTSQHKELYRRTGIIALFNEAGFTTYFMSNQSPQGAMIDNLAHDATHVEYMDSPRLDMQLVEAMRNALEKDESEKILFVLHSYGSHFSYRQRYSPEFSHFLPDDDVAINIQNVDMIRNAYDNSIRYTDYFLNEVIATLEKLKGVSSAMYYCSDHGEDLFDGNKKRFLHASPTVTYHQLHVPSLVWFSPQYRERNYDKVAAAVNNELAPATTYSVFHTMADMAHIISPYVVKRASLFDPYFDYGATRYYLDGHNQAVKLDRNIGIDDEELDFFTRHGIEL